MLIVKRWMHGLTNEFAPSENVGASWDTELATVYNHDFGKDIIGGKIGEWSPVHGSLATTKKIYVGLVANYFGKLGIAHIRMDSHDISNGDTIEIIGPTTGVYEAVVSSFVKLNSHARLL